MLTRNGHTAQTLLPEWHSFSLHPRLGRALHAQKFQSPTPIQSQAIPHALGGRDLIGVAETVSDLCDFFYRYLT